MSIWLSREVSALVTWTPSLAEVTRGNEYGSREDLQMWNPLLNKNINIRQVQKG